MPSVNFLVYALAIALGGLLAGGSIGYVLRAARARRQEGTLREAVRELNRKLEMAAHQPGPHPKPAPPRRFTGTEIAAILGSVGAILGVIFTAYNSNQGKTIDSLTRDLGQAAQEAKKSTDERKALDDSYRSLLNGCNLERWSKLTPVGRSAPSGTVRMDFTEFTGNCSSKGKVKLAFGGTAPGMLHCDSGSVQITLSQPSKILLLPSPAK